MPLGTERPTYQPVRPMPSHSRRDYMTIGRAPQSLVGELGSKYDWFKPIAEHIESLKEQPVARVAGLFSNLLGDPTDPANMAPGMNQAVGFMSAPRRIAQAKKLKEELAASQAIYAGYGAEHKGIKSLQNATEKYPHVMGHFGDVGMLPETSMPQITGKNQTAGYFQRMKAKTTKDLNAARETSDPNYRLKLSQNYGIAGKWGHATQNSIDNGITRHELGHAATALRDQPSALNYKANSAKYGYRANPDEIRANAIAAKRAPSMQVYRHGVGPEKKTIKSTYRPNDYMQRLKNEMYAALIHPETKDVHKRAFARDFMNYEVDLPPEFYKYYFDLPEGKDNMAAFLRSGRVPGIKSVRTK